MPVPGVGGSGDDHDGNGNGEAKNDAPQHGLNPRTQTVKATHDQNDAYDGWHQAWLCSHPRVHGNMTATAPKMSRHIQRHHRACPGDPRLAFCLSATKTWMGGGKPAQKEWGERPPPPPRGGAPPPPLFPY